ncbi:unnamed protein product, partial [Dicrocoelium dendriticum]
LVIFNPFIGVEVFVRYKKHQMSNISHMCSSPLLLLCVPLFSMPRVPNILLSI